MNWRLVAALVTGAMAAMILLAGVIFKLKTPAGTLIFRVDQDAAIVSKATGRLSARPATGEPPPLALAPFSPEQAKQHQQAWADYLGMPVEWRNSLGMEFVLIPPGEFLDGFVARGAGTLSRRGKSGW